MFNAELMANSFIGEGDRRRAESTRGAVLQTIVDSRGQVLAPKRPVPEAGGPAAKCVRQIEALQAVFQSSGYSREGGYWWAHSMPERGMTPERIYRWTIE